MAEKVERPDQKEPSVLSGHMEYYSKSIRHIRHQCTLMFCEMFYACTDESTCPYGDLELVHKHWKRYTERRNGEDVEIMDVPEDPRWFCPGCREEFELTGEVRTKFAMIRPSQTNPNIMEEFATERWEQTQSEDRIQMKCIKLPPLPPPRDPIARATFDARKDTLKAIAYRAMVKLRKYRRRKRCRARNQARKQRRYQKAYMKRLFASLE